MTGWFWQEMDTIFLPEQNNALPRVVSLCMTVNYILSWCVEASKELIRSHFSGIVWIDKSAGLWSRSRNLLSYHITRSNDIDKYSAIGLSYTRHFLKKSDKMRKKLITKGYKLIKSCHYSVVTKTWKKNVVERTNKSPSTVLHHVLGCHWKVGNVFR